MTRHQPADGPESGCRAVFHADDFGETEEITRGIIRAIEGGILKSTTILANMPASELGVTKAGELAEQASFGVHINLCEGRPLTSGASLVDETGRFWTKRVVARKALTGSLNTDELRREVEAQVEFVASRGIAVSHLDGHKHLHMLPGVREAVIEAARRFGIERVRVMAEGAKRVLSAPRRAVREMVASQARPQFAAAALRSPDRIRDLADFLGGPPERLAVELGGLSGLTEVVCHPGTATADEEKPGSCDRARELEYVTQPALERALARQGVEIVSYWEV